MRLAACAALRQLPLPLPPLVVVAAAAANVLRLPQDGGTPCLPPPAGIPFDGSWDDFVSLSRDIMKGRNSREQQETVAGAPPLARSPARPPACQAAGSAAGASLLVHSALPLPPSAGPDPARVAATPAAAAGVLAGLLPPQAPERFRRWVRGHGRGRGGTGMGRSCVPRRRPF